MTRLDGLVPPAAARADGAGSPAELRTGVVVVGGGPVGMTLALELGARGIPVVLLDQSEETTANPRCNTTNARSMEYFRGLGLADRIRRAGLPVDHTTDMVYTTSLAGFELTRFEFSSAREVLDGTAPEYADWPTPELQHRISQIFLEPILDRELRRYASIRVLRGWQVDGVTQDADAAVVAAHRTADDDRISVRGRYVVGCDGGGSSVRRALGVALAGDSQVGERRLSIYFRSSSVTLPAGRPGWRYLWRGERYHGAVIQLDGSSLYLCHARVPDHEDLADADADVAMREALGTDVPHEKIDVVRWIPRRLMAERFRVGRILLAGDAAHVWLPDGGFGMNTGIGDAVGLAWRLAAVHGGWGSEELLDDYAHERRSIGEATSTAAKTIGREMIELSVLTADPQLREDTAEGARLRAQAGELIQRVDRKQWYSMGVQLGSRYVGSPGVAADDRGTLDAPIGSIGDYSPTVQPGSRLPHFWTDDRAECVFDLLGQGFTLLRTRSGEDGGAADFERAAAAADVPVTVVDLPAGADAVYDQPLILVRPDWYVAWSGLRPPDDWTTVLQGLAGFGRPRRAEDDRAAELDGAAVSVIGDPFEGTSWAARA